MGENKEKLVGKINRLYELRGYSAYEVAVINGFTGTEKEWVALLTPYAKAVEGGFTGTEVEFYQLLLSFDDKVIAAQTAEANARASENAAAASEAAAQAAADNTVSEVEARLAGYVADAQSEKESAETARDIAENAQTGALAAAENASASETGAADSALLSESWAVGGTNTRDGENTNNAKYWSDEARNAAASGVSSFNSRAGIVMPAFGDYTAEMVGADPAGSAAAAEKSAKDYADSLAGNYDAAGSAATAMENANTHTEEYAAPVFHASAETTHGLGNDISYGHLRLSESTNSTNGKSNGIAATPSAVKAAYDKAVDARTAADNAQIAADEAYNVADYAKSAAANAQTAAQTAQNTANAALPKTGTAADSAKLNGQAASYYATKQYAVEIHAWTDQVNATATNGYNTANAAIPKTALAFSLSGTTLTITKSY